MKRFFSIGELSRLQNISRQTLIFYDKTGLFRPAYIDPDNGYRYYSSNQLDYLDTICIMKRIGFSLGEIKAHMKSYTIDDSIVALRKQLSIIDRQIKELQMIKKRVENRCLQMEHSVSIRDCSDIVSVEEVSSRYILLQEVAAPYTLEMLSIATKECFARAFREQLPVFFQSGAIVPYERILQGRYTEASAYRKSRQYWRNCGASQREERVYLPHRRLSFHLQSIRTYFRALQNQSPDHRFRFV